MTLTRKRLLAGVVGLAIGGVAATADPPRDAKAGACHAPLPVIPVAAAETAPKIYPAPVAVPTPAPSQAPTVAVVQLTPPPAAAPPLPKIDLAPPAPVPAAPLPTIDLAPLPKVDAAPPLPDIKIAPPAVPEGPKVDLPPTPPAIAAAPVADVPKPTEPAKPLAQPDPAVPVPTAAVRVVLTLGTGQPRFDVLSGEDTLLKVVCDKVDVRSPSANGDAFTPLKAAGGVRFSAPGCDGTCDELTVRPGTGDVELAGNVRVRCREGKGETEIVTAGMKFKLGTAPAYSVPVPAVSTSFAPGRK